MRRQEHIMKQFIDAGRSHMMTLRVRRVHVIATPIDMTTRAFHSFITSILLLLLAGCAGKGEKTIIVRKNSVTNDFVLNACLDAGYIVNGYPSKTTTTDQFCGRIEITSPTGVKLGEGFVQDGVLSGPFVSLHTNGEISSFEYYRNGKRQAVSVDLSMHKDILRTTSFTGGEKSGYEIYWNTNGLLEMRIKWKLGKPSEVSVFKGGEEAERFVGTNATLFLRDRFWKRDWPTNVLP